VVKNKSRTVTLHQDSEFDSFERHPKHDTVSLNAFPDLTVRFSAVMIWDILKKKSQHPHGKGFFNDAAIHEMRRYIIRCTAAAGPPSIAASWKYQFGASVSYKRLIR
jgi:hypothetical protein